jgi:two-component system CitB family sensor kinase
VADSGPGVPIGESDVFADGFSTKAPRVGIHRGLGLALVHRLVTQAGGRVDVSNERGAVFRVLLPARRPTEAEREPAW